MSVRHFILTALIATAAFAADEPVQMRAIQIRPSDIYFKVGYVSAMDEVMEVRVTSVVRGSPAEKVGIREGDFLVSIKGAPVVGMKRSTLYGRDGGISISGEITFKGQRGFFRKPWSITVEATSLRDEKSTKKATEPTTTSVTPR